MQNKKVFIKRFVDLAMILLLLGLMPYQFTGARVHEWLGVVMAVFAFFHQILNWQWYSSIFKGKYSAYRIFLALINILLIISFVVTVISGISMSSYAVPFFYGVMSLSTAKVLHLSSTYWVLILCGLHLGLHIPSKTSKIELANKIRKVLTLVNAVLAFVGLYVFYKNKILDYLFAKNMFPFFDDSKTIAVVCVEYFLILQCWTFIGFLISSLLKRLSNTKAAK